MRIFLSTDASARDIGRALDLAQELAGNAASVHLNTSGDLLSIDIQTNGNAIDPAAFSGMAGIDGIEEPEPIYSLSAATTPGTRAVDIPFADISIGGENFVVMVGPCAVENDDDLLETARVAKNCGARILRGGAFKPRTSPYSFQGVGPEGLEMLARVREEVGIGIITEAMEPATVGAVAEIADIIQIGSRNMHNYPLLKEAGQAGKPVLVKRGMSATLEEWLGAAEYVLSNGNPDVILCERGIRTFSRHSRHTLDIGVIPVIHERTNLPVIVDPSHATGQASRVPAMARAAVAAGADGLLMEIHPEPSRALSDGFQALSFDEYDKLMGELKSIADAIGRKV
jgi:3-deoxy-7-phosphoheptulonate synthase